MPTASAAPSLRAICLEGFRRNRVPAVVLQIFAALLLALYHLVPAARAGFDLIGHWKAESGPAFAVISTAIFGGLIPWLVLARRGRMPPDQRLPQLAFFLAFWALQGAMVDGLYSLQDRWFGSGTDPATLFWKMLVDQGPYNLIWATPVTLLGYGWKEAGFSWSRLRRNTSPSDLRRRYIGVQGSSWVVWIPAVLMIYSLPPELQIPLFNLVLCFFSLVLAFVSRA